MLISFPQVKTVLPVTVIGEQSPYPHLTYEFFHLVFCSVPLRRGSEREAGWEFDC